MLTIESSNYSLKINAKNHSLDFSLGNFSNTGWFWSSEGASILLFLYRILKSDFRYEFIDNYRKEASNNPQDHEFFVVELMRYSKDKDALRELLYGMVGDNNFFMDFSESIENFFDRIENNIDIFEDKLPDIFKNKNTYKFVKYLLDESIITFDISPNMSIEEYFDQVDLNEFPEVTIVAKQLYDIFSNILENAVDVDNFYYSALEDEIELGSKMTDEYISEACDIILISTYGNYFYKDPVDILNLNYDDIYNFIKEYISKYPTDFELITVLIPFLKERKIKISVDIVEEICNSIGLDEKTTQKWIMTFKQISKKYGYII